MMTLISFFFSFIFHFLDKTKKRIFFIPSALLLILFGMSFDFIDWSNFNEEVFIYAKPSPQFRCYALYVITVFSMLFGINMSQKQRIKKINFTVHYRLNILRKLYYYFSFASIFACGLNVLNVIRAGGFILIFENPREYEMFFGYSTPINYIYFLNVPALCLYIYLHHNKYFVKYALGINFLLVLISFLHGIKYTIFDTILFPSCFLYFLKKELTVRPLIIIMVILLSIFVGFSLLIRGGDEESPLMSIVMYILPNFYNLFYSVEKDPYAFGLGALYSLYVPDKIPNFLSAFNNGNQEAGFVLNESYNMFTIFYNLYCAFNILGPLFLIHIYRWFYRIYQKREVNLFYLFLTTFVFFGLLFSFYFYSFTKTKYVYYVTIFYLINRLCKINPLNVDKMNGRYKENVLSKRITT